MKKLWLQKSKFLFFICASLTACSPGSDNQSSKDAQLLPIKIQVNEKTARSIGIITKAAERRNLRMIQTLPGKIEPDVGKEVDISSRVAGRVDKLLVVPGQTVNKGDVLALITSREISDLESQMIVAHAKLETAKAQEERQRQVYEEQVNLPKALIDARIAFKNATLHRNLMESQLHREQTLYQEKISAHKSLVIAKTAFEQAEAEYEHAKSNLKREEDYYKNKAIMRGPYQLAQAERIKSEKELQAIQRQLKFFGVTNDLVAPNLKENSQSGELKITAPIKGNLSFFEIAPGELIEADKPIFRITDLSSVLVSAEAPESEIPLARLGKHIHVTIRGMKESVPATIDIVANHVNPNTHTLSVRARLQNHENVFKPGMFADVKLDEQDSLVLAIPKSAVQEVNGHKIVFVRKEDGFEERTVTIGAEETEYVEVTSGLQPGEEVVVQGSLLLKTELESKQKDLK